MRYQEFGVPRSKRVLILNLLWYRGSGDGEKTSQEFGVPRQVQSKRVPILISSGIVGLGCFFLLCHFFFSVLCSDCAGLGMCAPNVGN